MTYLGHYLRVVCNFEIRYGTKSLLLLVCCCRASRGWISFALYLSCRVWQNATVGRIKNCKKKRAADLLLFTPFDHLGMREDNLLLQRIRAGDDRATEEVYLLCRNDFFRAFAHKWKLTSDQLIELYQDSFIALLESIQQGKIDSIHQGWLPLLKGIGRNVLLMQRRKEAKNIGSVEPALFDPSHTDAEDQEAFLQVLSTELNQFETKCKELLEMRVLKALSFKAIYQQLNPSILPTDDPLLSSGIAGIRVQYGRCVERLRKKVFEQLKNLGLWN